MFTFDDVYKNSCKVGFEVKYDSKQVFGESSEHFGGINNRANDHKSFKIYIIKRHDRITVIDGLVIFKKS